MTVDPDQELLLFIAAQEVALARQAAALLQITDDETAELLELLRHQRLVSRVELRSVLPAAYRITRDGAEQTDSALPPLRPLSPDAYRHEIAIAWLWVAARHGQLGQLREVLTRREMQAADATLRSESLLDTPGASFKDETGEGDRGDVRHAYPDLALVQADQVGGWATLDVILAAPDPARLRTTLGRASRDLLICDQLFLVEDDDGALQALIANAAAELGLTDHVHVKRLAHDGIGGA